jgi:two-component system chemotaxis response regulator CheB
MEIASSKKSRSLSTGNFAVVVVGASAGGFNAIFELVKNLPEDAKAAILIVVHHPSSTGISNIIQHLQRYTKFNCKLAEDEDTIKARTIYFAVPGLHLIVNQNNRIIMGTGPEENRFKPSIDTLFRTAAVQYRSRTIGIIMSGLMDDGVSGILTVMRCGGTTIVQDPSDAESPDLPLAVLRKMKPDYTLSAGRMGNVIQQIARKPPKKNKKIPDEIANEVAITQKVLTGIDEVSKLGTQSLFTCPDCGGNLWVVNDPDMQRYRCFTGHAYSEPALLSQQNKSIQSTLWIALRLLEERVKMLDKMPYIEKTKSRARELEKHINRIRDLLADLQLLEPPADAAQNVS